MKDRNQDFLLGLAAILFLVLFLATFLFLIPSLGQKDMRQITIHFPHERGLAPIKEGSPVLLSGAIEVGKLTHVDVRQPSEDELEAGTARTTIVAVAEIWQDLELYENCEITTDVPLIGGTGTVVIANVGSPREGPVAGPIEGEPPQGLAAFSAISRRLTGEDGLVARIEHMLDPEASGSLLNKVKMSVEDVNAMTGELRVQLSAAQQKTLLGKIHQILDDVNATTSQIETQVRAGNEESVIARVNEVLDVLQQSLAEIRAMLREDRPLIHEAVGSVARTARLVEEDVVGPLRAELAGQDPDSLLSKLHDSMDRVRNALANVEALAESGQRTFQLTRPQLERILENVEEASETFQQTVKDIQRNPARLLKGPTPREAAQLDVLSAASDFAQAAEDLDSAAARLRAILETVPADQRVAADDGEVRKIYRDLQAAFEKFQRAESYFWDELK